MDKKEFCKNTGIDEITFDKILQGDLRDLCALVEDYCGNPDSEKAHQVAALALYKMQAENNIILDILKSREIEDFNRLLKPEVAPLVQYKKPKRKKSAASREIQAARKDVVLAAARKLGLHDPETRSEADVSNKIKDLQEKYTFQERIRKNRSRKIKPNALQIRQFEKMFIEVNWVILPPGEEGRQEIYRYFRRIARARPHRIMDWDRLEYIMHLLPENPMYHGVDKFEGYMIAVIEESNKVIFECPMYGNAIYVIPRMNWIEFSRLTKSELMNIEGITRIIHSENWKSELLNAIKK